MRKNAEELLVENGRNQARGIRKRFFLMLEFVVLFVGIPTIYVLNLIPAHPFLVLWLIASICLMLLLHDQSFDHKRLWQVGQWRRHMRKIMMRFSVLAPIVWLYVAVFEPDLLFGFPRQQPMLWVLVTVLYPILSVYPQGIVHRAFLFHRYEVLVKGQWARIMISALAFSFMHIIFGNPEAVILTLAGGVIFGKTYEETGSLVLAGIEHTLYGNFVFTIGLGVYLHF